jgi:hypothetical protein
MMARPQSLETLMPVSTLTASEQIPDQRSPSTFAHGVGVEEPGAVSWPAILAGAAAAAALSLILLVLGVGLGLSAVSPWSQEGISAATWGISTIVWITFCQIVASGMGGYLAGRLRVRWAGAQLDEVYFRDTAHGFLAWAIASLATAALLGSVISNVLGGGLQAGASVAGSALTTSTAAVAGAALATSEAESDNGPMNYLLDTLFRKDAAATSTPPIGGDTTTPAPTAEVARIFMNSIGTGALPPEDVRYVGQVVAQRTGLTAPDAEKRVVDAYSRAQTQWQEVQTKTKQAADAARRSSAYGALWLFVSLLAGAFAASWAATFGGRQRDF